MILSIYKHVPKDQIFNGLMFVKKHFLYILEQRDIEGIFINKKNQTVPLKKMSVNLNAKNSVLFYGYFQYLLLKHLWLILRSISITTVCVLSQRIL